MHFQSFLNTELVQVVEIFSHARQEHAYPTELIQLIPWLLIQGAMTSAAMVLS